MRRGAVFAGATALALGAGWLASQAPDWAREAELFRVREVRVEGVRFLGRDEVIRAAAFAEDASVWDDLDPIVDALSAHPLVHEVRIRRRLPSTLVLEVREAEPVALVPTPTLEPVDASGRLLPLDPADHRLDLPVLRVRPERPDPETGQPSRDVRILAGEAKRIMDLDPAMDARLSELWLETDGSLGMTLVDPRVQIRFRAPLSARLLDRGLRTLEDARARGEARNPVLLDLRFADQVVVRLDRAAFPPRP